MKNRNLDHKDDWATPPYFLKEEIGLFDLDPCPFQHDLAEWNGLELNWAEVAESVFINPPYNLIDKTAFVKKTIEEFQKGLYCKMLLPVSTSTTLFHDFIDRYGKVKFVRRRIPFIGINSKGQYVNWHLWDRKAPDGVEHIKANGQHDSMIVIFDGR